MKGSVFLVSRKACDWQREQARAVGRRKKDCGPWDGTGQSGNCVCGFWGTAHPSCPPGEVWVAPGLQAGPLSLYTGASPPLPFVSLEGAQSLTARGDGQLGASEKQCWPGIYQNLAEQQRESKEELILGQDQVRPLCLSESSPEGRRPPRKPLAWLSVSPPFLPARQSRLIFLSSCGFYPPLEEQIVSNMTCWG